MIKRNIWSHFFGCGLVVFLVLLLVGCTNGPTTTGPSSTPTSTTSVYSTSVNSGDVKALANKPLHVPSVSSGNTCPATMGAEKVSPDRRVAYGNGPVYVVASSPDKVLHYTAAPFIGDTSSSLGGAQVVWEINPSYSGLVLIRGQQVDGSHPLQFNGGLSQPAGNPQGTEPIQNSLVLRGGGPHSASMWPTWVTFVRLSAPGCYAYQIDGQNFSEVIVFHAEPE